MHGPIITCKAHYSGSFPDVLITPPPSADLLRSFEVPYRSCPRAFQEMHRTRPTVYPPFLHNTPIMGPPALELEAARRRPHFHRLPLDLLPPARSRHRLQGPAVFELQGAATMSDSSGNWKGRQCQQILTNGESKDKRQRIETRKLMFMNVTPYSLPRRKLPRRKR
jgi:hypothetical protein